jgi:hypothetical protein
MANIIDRGDCPAADSQADGEPPLPESSQEYELAFWSLVGDGSEIDPAGPPISGLHRQVRRAARLVIEGANPAPVRKWRVFGEWYPKNTPKGRAGVPLTLPIIKAYWGAFNTWYAGTVAAHVDTMGQPEPGQPEPEPAGEIADALSVWQDFAARLKTSINPAAFQAHFADAVPIGLNKGKGETRVLIIALKDKASYLWVKNQLDRRVKEVARRHDPSLSIGYDVITSA